MKDKDTKNGAKKRLVGALLAAVFLLFMFYSPHLFSGRLECDPYSDWLQYKREPAVSVITVWHVVGVRPYVGSLGNWIEKQAQKYTKKYVGIYFSVKAYSLEDAAKEMARGVFPDVMSFPAGEYPEELFFKRGNDTSPLPTASVFCLSKRVFAYDPSAFEDGDLSRIASSSGTEEEFKRGKCQACICDIRTAGNLLRALQLGKMRYFDITPSDEAPLAQCIAISKNIDPMKLPYAEGLIERMLSEEAQSSLCELGLIPAEIKATVEYELDWLLALYESVDRSAIPDAF